MNIIKKGMDYYIGFLKKHIWLYRFVMIFGGVIVGVYYLGSVLSALNGTAVPGARERVLWTMPVMLFFAIWLTRKGSWNVFWNLEDGKKTTKKEKV